MQLFKETISLYSLVLSSRGMLQADIFVENLVGLAVDESHCIEGW